MRAAGEPGEAPTMGVVTKIGYSHQDMIDFIIANPGVTQNALAARYGYSVGWVSNVMASDAWQSADVQGLFRGQPRQERHRPDEGSD